MTAIMFLIGVAVLVCTIVAGGLFIWHGHWGPVLLALFGGFAAKLCLGLVEMIFSPATLLAIGLAKRGSKVGSTAAAAAAAVLTRASYASYCVLVLNYIASIPGPAFWLRVIFAIAVGCAPFAWAANQTKDESAPANVDLSAAMIGIPISGILLGFGVSPVVAAAPIVLLFLLSAAFLTYRWAALEMPRVWLEGLLQRS